MEFSLDQFYRLNRRILIWVALFGLIWLLRDFFGLIFLVFLLTFIAIPLSALVQRYARLPHSVALVLVYACFLGALGSFVRFVAPTVMGEANALMGNLPQIEESILGVKKRVLTAYPSLEPMLMGYLKSNVPEESLRELDARQSAGGQDPNDEALIRLFMARQMERVREHAPQLVKFVWSASANMLLALLFSFVICLDTERLKQEVVSLKLSRLRDFYEQTAQPVVRFGYVVGRAMRAQAVIALVNTALTATGLLVLGVPSVALLSLIVFGCSFIPVLGVLISTTPIVLVALNSGGLPLAGAVIGLVAVSHALEAYVLNPLIYGRHLKLNPALVLMILFIGHHAFGLWGMLLGVPVTYYLIHDVFGVPLRGEGSPPEVPAP